MKKKKKRKLLKSILKQMKKDASFCDNVLSAIAGNQTEKEETQEEKIQIQTNKMVILEDGTRYVLLTDTNYEKEHYFMAMGVDEREDLQMENRAIFHENREADGVYLNRVTDEKLIKKLLPMLKPC